MPTNQQLRRRNHMLWERLISTATDAELRTLHEIAVTELKFRNLRPLSVDSESDGDENLVERHGTGQHRIPPDDDERAEAEEHAAVAAEPAHRRRPDTAHGPTGEVLVRRPGRPPSDTQMRRVTGR